MLCLDSSQNKRHWFPLPLSVRGSTILFSCCSFLFNCKHRPLTIVCSRHPSVCQPLRNAWMYSIRALNRSEVFDHIVCKRHALLYLVQKVHAIFLRKWERAREKYRVKTQMKLKDRQRISSKYSAYHHVCKHTALFVLVKVLSFLNCQLKPTLSIQLIRHRFHLRLIFTNQLRTVVL